jgi:tripartite-type tricarboxylate transporter receptor subunit TctC
MAPAGTPASVVKTLNTALNDALGEPEVRKRLAELGAEPRPQSPEDFAAFMREEDKRMRALHQAGLFKIE